VAEEALSRLPNLNGASSRVAALAQSSPT